MSHRGRPGPCALDHGERATHLCVSEAHGLVRLCSHHAGQHRARPDHLVFTLEHGLAVLGEWTRRGSRHRGPRGRLVRRRREREET